MPPRTVLSSEQRTRLFSIPTDTATMTRHYLLDAADLAVVRARRRASNRLGFAVQLCALRHPGRVLDPSEVLPKPMLAFVAKQLGVDPALFGDYARRAETRREHLLELQKLVRLRSFGLDDWRACLRVGADTAWATDRGEPIIQAMLAHLRANGVLLPSAAVLERIGLAACPRTQEDLRDARGRDVRRGAGHACQVALLARGMVLANGDRRDCFVVIDHEGGHHALNKKLTGLTLEEMRGRLSDIDRAALPSVEEAKERQARHRAAQEARRQPDRPAQAKTRERANTLSDGPARAAETPRNAEAEKNSSKRELGKTAGEIRTAWAITRHRGAERFAEEIEKRGLILVYVTPDQAKASERAQAFAKAINRQNRALREGFAVVDQRGTVTRIDQRVTGDLRAEIDKRLGVATRNDARPDAQSRPVSDAH